MHRLFILSPHYYPLALLQYTAAEPSVIYVLLCIVLCALFHVTMCRTVLLHYNTVYVTEELML